LTGITSVVVIIIASACTVHAQTQPAAPANDADAQTNPEATPGEPSVKPSKQASRFSRPAETEIDFQEGLLQYSRGQLRQAEQKFKDVIQADPADADEYYYLGLAQLDQNRSKEAVENFDQSIRLDPTSDEVRLARASALIRLRRLDEAEEDIKLLEKDPRWSGAVHYLRGHLYYNEGKLDKAAEEFKKSELSGQPEATNARLYGGLTYLRMKNLSQARRSFRDAATSAGGGDLTVTSAAEQVDATLGRAVAAQRRLDARISIGYE
jgi:tetratricopeptide (TPR) repeat protein